MKKLLFILLLSPLLQAKANDSIDVKINKLSFSDKDSLLFSCRIHDYAARGLAAATMNVWIQSVETKQTWKFRYPVLNGELDASLAIGDSIPPGKYAVNFILQKGLFKIQGMLRNNYSYKSLNYLMMLKGSKKLFNTVELSESGAFLIRNILFEDRSFIVFSPEKKVKKNDLFISIATPLDSAFTPLAIFTQLIDVGPERQPSVRSDESYRFNFYETYVNTTLPEVIVTAKGKKKVDLYNDMYSSGLFQDDNAKIFDGLDNPELSNSLDIETFLLANVAGLTLGKIDLGNNYFIWRNEPVAVYVDEFRMNDCEAINISPSDVAMIKVFPPPASMNSGIPKSSEPTADCPVSTSGFSGAIAIYTKKGRFDDRSSSRFRFSLKGYTALQSAWR